jgi:4-amino-4-deoxy-L-arabinose transferase-like glycosyltransferase
VAVLILVASSYLALTGLDSTYFWDDEALLSITAKNFLSTGQLTAWDGRNLYALNNGSYLSRELLVNVPPLDIYVAALSFRIFGISTWAARFPFAIAGLATLLVFALTLREEFGTQSWLWVYALGSLALSVTFLLFIRQCRYYALALLFSSIAYYAYRKCLATRHLLWFIIIGVSSTLLFFSNYLVGGAFLVSLAILHLVFHLRDFSVKDWGKVAIAVGMFASITVPYAIAHRIWHHPGGYFLFLDNIFLDNISVSPEPWLPRKLTLLWWNLRDIDRTSMLPWAVLALLALLLILRRERKLRRVSLEWALLGLGNIVVVALISIQPTINPEYAEVRYLVASLPFFAGLTGILLWLVHKWKKPLALVLFVALVCSNVFTLNILNKDFNWLLPAYIREVHNAYPTSIAAVSDYLRANAKQDELVYANPEYYNWPLLFYVGEKIKICCAMSRYSLISKEDLKEIDAPLWVDEHHPDWIVMFGVHPMNINIVRYFSRLHLSRKLRAVFFEYKLIKILDVYWFETQRPELNWHSFGPKTDFDRNIEGVYIFRRTGPFAR